MPNAKRSARRSGLAASSLLLLVGCGYLPGDTEQQRTAEPTSALSQAAGTPSVAPAAPVYDEGAAIQANVADLPGNMLDWVGLFVPGADVNTRVAWKYTGGLASGSLSFQGVPDGTYELRVYLNNSAQLLASSPSFTVTNSAATVQPSLPSYTEGDTISVSFAAFPGNTYDWVGLFVPGADAGTRVAWKHTGGQVSGSLSFSSVPPGTYELRAYFDNTTHLLASSATFSVASMGATIQASQASYAHGQAITADFSSLPGAPYDWVGLFVPGADVNTRVAWKYTGGLASGSLSFEGVQPGTYELRAYLNNSAQLLASSPSFTVTASAAAIQPSLPSYTAGDAVVADFSSMPGNAYDWVGLFTPGADVNTRVAWKYTGGLASGSLSFSSVPPGTYELRAYVNNTTDLLASSATFSVTTGGASVQPSQSSYALGDAVVANFSSLPGNALDWVGLFAPGADVNTRVAWKYTGGGATGSLSFSSVPAGTYELRVYLNNSAQLLASSPSFTVANSAATIQASQASYTHGQAIVANFSSLPGATYDWVGLFVPGADAGTRVGWKYTGGLASGSLSFEGVQPGTYELRAYFNNTSNLLASSPSFAVTASAAAIQPSQSAYALGEDVVANFSSMPGNTYDWVGVFVPGADASTRVAWLHTGGQVSGSLSFSGIPAGTYELRAYLDNTTQVLATSTLFTVGDGGSGGAGGSGGSGGAGAGGSP